MWYRCLDRHQMVHEMLIQTHTQNVLSCLTYMYVHTHITDTHSYTYMNTSPQVLLESFEESIHVLQELSDKNQRRVDKLEHVCQKQEGQHTSRIKDLESTYTVSLIDDHKCTLCTCRLPKANLHVHYAHVGYQRLVDS